VPSSSPLETIKTLLLPNAKLLFFPETSARLQASRRIGHERYLTTATTMQPKFKLSGIEHFTHRQMGSLKPFKGFRKNYSFEFLDKFTASPCDLDTPIGRCPTGASRID
jgi:hypothetical protein